MLLSIVVVLTPEYPTLLPPTQGNAVHAAFLDLVRRLDPALGEALHRAGREKPFTTSPLQGPFEREAGGGLRLRPGREYWLRLTSLEPALSHALLQLDARAIPSLPLFDASLRVLKVHVRSEEHPWAGQTTDQDLYTTWMATDRVPPRKLRLHFYSPTTFQSNRLNVPVPLPRLVFLTLGAKWNRYASVHLGEEIATVIESLVGLSRYELKTRMLDFGRYKKVGFVGDCEFQLQWRSQDEVWARAVHLLADFAFYAGVGYKTTMGMGQVRRSDASVPAAARARAVHPER